MPSVFLCHASEDKPLVEPVQLALAGTGSTVFYDGESLPPGGDYHARIRDAIRRCDLFIFFASKAAIAPGKFTLTELKFARERWPSPVGRVLTVVVGGLRPNELPPYLQSATVLTVSGNAAAEVRAAAEAMLMQLRLQKLRRLGLSLALGGVVLAASSSFTGLHEAVSSWLNERDSAAAGPMPSLQPAAHLSASSPGAQPRWLNVGTYRTADEARTVAHLAKYAGLDPRVVQRVHGSSLVDVYVGPVFDDGAERDLQLRLKQCLFQGTPTSLPASGTELAHHLPDSPSKIYVHVGPLKLGESRQVQEWLGRCGIPLAAQDATEPGKMKLGPFPTDALARSVQFHLESVMQVGPTAKLSN